LADSPDPNISSSEPPADAKEHKIGYGNPPRHTQFRKGVSGNPSGRPKRPEGVSIKEILDGDQMGKNGEIVSKREALVIRMLNDALAGNQKAFGHFLKLLNLSGLKRTVRSPTVSTIFYQPKQMTPEEYATFSRNFGLPRDQWT
jgi:Family of unknown function (DUF5681)